MRSLFIFLLLTLCNVVVKSQETPFQVIIVAGKDKESSSVEVKGLTEHLITSDEANSWGIFQDDIDRCSTSIISDLYVHDCAYYDPIMSEDEPWYIFAERGIPPTRVVQEAKSAEVLEIFMQPKILKTAIFENNSTTFPTTFNTAISQSVSRSTTSSWTETHSHSITQTINYSFKLGDIGAGGSTSYTWTGEWGKGGATTDTEVLGSTDSATTTVPPGGAIRVDLAANTGTMKIQVIFQESVTGSMMCRSQNDWGDFSVPNCILAGSSSKETVQQLEVGFYTNTRTTVTELSGGHDNAEEADVMAMEANLPGEARVSLRCSGIDAYLGAYDNGAAYLTPSNSVDPNAVWSLTHNEEDDSYTFGNINSGGFLACDASNNNVFTANYPSHWMVEKLTNGYVALSCLENEANNNSPYLYGGEDRMLSLTSDNQLPGAQWDIVVDPLS